MRGASRTCPPGTGKSARTEQIDVGAGSLILRVRGQNLTLRSMTDSEVRIFGKIDAVEYVR